MRKTTVYVPDELKRQLAIAASRTGRSGPDLIREGIRLVSAADGGVQPSIPLFASGDPDLAERVDEQHLARFGERCSCSTRAICSPPCRPRRADPR